MHRDLSTRARAARLSFLIDAASYFDAFGRAAQLARRSILVVGWDFDTRTVLWPTPPAGVPGRLGPFLRDPVTPRDSPWPAGLGVDIEDEEVEVVRTEPAFAGRPNGELLPDPALIDPVEPLEPARVVTGLLPSAMRSPEPSSIRRSRGMPC
jgi:hypothetical protein